MDLLSLTLHLRPLINADDGPSGEETPRWWGRAAHALLLNTIRRYDDTLAAKLHDADGGVRPFTTSTLQGRFPQGRLDPSASYTLRLTAIDAEVTRHLLQACQPGGPLAAEATIELDYHPFQILSYPTGQSFNPEAQLPNTNLQPEIIIPPPKTLLTTYADLSAPYLLAQTAPSRQLTLRFLSPTSFKSREMHNPLPLPEWVFGSLLERWNAYAPITFPPELKRYAAECLAVSRFKLESRTVPIKGRGLRMGGVGEVTYVSLNYDRYWMSLVTVLAEFAHFAGVGVGTAMGMGQCILST